MHDEDGDIISEAQARRRGMVYRKDSRGHVCQAEIEAPLLLDQLYNREVIQAEHHFYGVQFLTMRKLFLMPVGFKIGMLITIRDEDQAASKPIPMEDTDYLRVLRGVKRLDYQNLLRDICDETADPAYYYRYATHSVSLAFDALSEAIKNLWDAKKACVEAAENAAGIKKQSGM